MHAAIAVPGNSRAILTHLFGRGLEDDRYVVERFQSMADGEIRRRPRRRAAGEGPAQGEGGDRVAEDRAGDAARAQRDHRLHRNAHRGRRPVLGRPRHRPVRGAQAGLSGVPRERPAGPAPAFPATGRIRREWREEPPRPRSTASTSQLAGGTARRWRDRCRLQKSRCSRVPHRSSTSMCGQSTTAWKAVCAPICCYACWPVMSNATCASSLHQC